MPELHLRKFLGAAEVVVGEAEAEVVADGVDLDGAALLAVLLLAEVTRRRTVETLSLALANPVM